MKELYTEWLSCAIPARFFSVNCAGIPNLCASIPSHVTLVDVRGGFNHTTCSHKGFYRPHFGVYSPMLFQA